MGTGADATGLVEGLTVAAVLGIVGGTLLAYALVSIIIIWRERPVVIWDDYEGRWRAADRLGSKRS